MDHLRFVGAMMLALVLVLESTAGAVSALAAAAAPIPSDDPICVVGSHIAADGLGSDVAQGERHVPAADGDPHDRSPHARCHHVPPLPTGVVAADRVLPVLALHATPSPDLTQGFASREIRPPLPPPRKA